LESLVQAGKVKKINLDQENNFAFYFVKYEENGVKGYYIDSETKGRVIIDYATLRARMSPPIDNIMRFPIFTFESDQGFVPKETAKSGRFGDNNQLSWTFINHTLEISGNGAMPEYQSAYSTPWSSYITNINNVIINNGVTNISSYRVFSVTNITTVTIPESVVNIGTQAFIGASLTSVTVNWETADALPSLGADVFSNNLSNAVLYVPAGTKSIYEAADQWKNFRTIKERGIIVQPDPVSRSKGSFSLSLAVPESGTFTATFDVTFPQKFTPDESATKLAASLGSSYELKITAKENGVWSFEINPNTNLRSGSANAFREVVNVAYTVDKSLEDGYYELKVQDLNLVLSDGTVIQEEEIVVPVIFNSVTRNEATGSEINIWLSGENLYVRTPVATKLSIYTLTGAQVKQLSVGAGVTTFDLNLPKGIYIVRGSNGWTKKIINN
jgi:hypothetical protein